MQPQNKTPLNPIAHVLIEDIVEFDDVVLEIDVDESAQTVLIVADTIQPVSPHIVHAELAARDDGATQTLGTNFLLAPDAGTACDDDNDDSACEADLILDAASLSAQIPHSGRQQSRPPRAKRTRAARKEEAPTTNAPVAPIPLMEIVRDDTHDDKLISLDDLLDDVALEEELADVGEDNDAPTACLVSPPPRRERRTHRQQRPRRTARTLPVGWQKMLAAFVGLSFGIVLPLQAMTHIPSAEQSRNSVVETGLRGITAIRRAATSASQQDFSQAGIEFERAGQAFGLASDQLRAVNAQVLGLAELLPSTRRELNAARNLLRAGESSAAAAATLADGLTTISKRSGESPTAAIALFDVFVENALPRLRDAAQALKQVPHNAIPPEHRDTLAAANGTTATLLKSLQTFHDSRDALQTFLGRGARQRYLILFQNNTELRPTGGFWGSFAEVDILNGELTQMRVPGGGTYDLQGQLREFVEAPAPLQLVGARWEFQDANWFPDFSASAQKAAWFYEKSGGPSVDGVIALNATWVADVIELTGPIALPQYGRTIDGENFLFETQRQVELDYNREENRPKAFIGDVASVLIDRLTHAQGDTFLALAPLLSEGLAARDIQIYHRDPKIASALRDLGWDGAMLSSTGDYFSLVHTNIGGGKTDGVIDDDVEIDSRVRTDGRVENSVTIVRTHHGLRTSLFSGLNNVSFTRIFVPRGSELLNVEGATPPDAGLFERDASLSLDPMLEQQESSRTDERTGAIVAESFGKTSFGHWMQTPPGGSSTLTFTYLLPKDILDEPREDWFHTAVGAIGAPQTVRHSIVIQRQSGVLYRTTSYRFDPGESLSPVWSSEDTMLQLLLKTNQDAYAGFLLERR